MARPLLLDPKNRITGINSMNAAAGRLPNMSAIPPAQTPQCTMVTFEPRAPVAPIVAPAHARQPVRPSIAPLSSTDTTESRILNIINFARESMANEPPYPAAVSKSMDKLTPPNYSGSSSFEDFEQFVTGLLHHFKTLQVMSPDFDQVHIRLMGQSLTGDALDWYNRTIDTNDDRSAGWGFEMAVIALKERFVHRLSIQDAATKFDLLAQGKQ